MALELQTLNPHAMLSTTLRVLFPYRNSEKQVIGALPHSQAENGPNALQWIHCDKTVSSLSKTNTIAVSPFQRLFLFSDDATFEYKKSMNMVLTFNPKQYPLPSKKTTTNKNPKKPCLHFASPQSKFALLTPASLCFGSLPTHCSPVLQESRAHIWVLHMVSLLTCFCFQYHLHRYHYANLNI